MIVTDLRENIASYIRRATEMWVAVALLNEEGLEILTNLSNYVPIQHYLIGIDLPTTPSALTILKEKITPNKFEAAISYTTGKVFHPKIYLLQLRDKKIAFIGSANLTPGGMGENIEMSCLTEDQRDCENLLAWFNVYWKNSYPIDDYNLTEYKNNFDSEEYKETRGKVKKKFYLKRKSDIPFDLDLIDFTNLFFKHQHHYALRDEIQTEISKAADDERKNTWDKLNELHKIIFPRFEEYQIAGLHPHRMSEYIVSHYYHAEGFTSSSLGAIWLSYGKHPDEIYKYQQLFAVANKKKDQKEKDRDRELQSFINHARIQIKVEHTLIVISLLFAKGNGGSQFDRQHFFDQMKSLPYRKKFFTALQNLPEEYWIQINNERIFVHLFSDPDILYTHCKKDKPTKYFIIGRDYKIDDTVLTNNLLPTTVLTEFQRLYPIYDMMRHKL